jgi:hypothetical protein
MNKRTQVLALLFLALGLPPLSWARTCHSDDPAGTHCTLQVEKLRPTQFAVGSIAVDCKADKISGKSKKRLKKYLKDPAREVPAVVGPDGNFYITDHHHLSTALYRAKSKDWGDDDKVLHLKIIENHTGEDMRWGDFWSEMQRLNRSYNYDNKGTPDMNFALLPTNVGGLLNDPYRTLSRWVRESCGYVKLGKEQCAHIRTDHPHKAPYFMELYWGELFRKYLPLTVATQEVCKSIPYSSACLSNEAGQLKARYEPAMELAASEQAKQFFEDLGLDPWDYGYNPSGERVPLSWTGENMACEETDSD